MSQIARLQEPQSLQRIFFPRAFRNTAGGGISQNQPASWQYSSVSRLTSSKSLLRHCQYSPHKLIASDPCEGQVAVIEPLSADGSLECHPPSPHTLQFLFSAFLSFPAQALAVVQPRYFPSHRLCCVLTELTCVEESGWKSFFLTSWSSQVSCICLKTRIRRVLFLSVFSICLFFFFPLGSSQN